MPDTTPSLDSTFPTMSIPLENVLNQDGALIENHVFDEITLGQEARSVRTLTLDDIRAFAAVSGDTNPAHLDAGYAAAMDYMGDYVRWGTYASKLGNIDEAQQALLTGARLDRGGIDGGDRIVREAHGGDEGPAVRGGDGRRLIEAGDGGAHVQRNRIQDRDTVVGRVGGVDESVAGVDGDAGDGAAAYRNLAQCREARRSVGFDQRRFDDGRRGLGQTAQVGAQRAGREVVRQFGVPAGTVGHDDAGGHVAQSLHVVCHAHQNLFEPSLGGPPEGRPGGCPAPALLAGSRRPKRHVGADPAQILAAGTGGKLWPTTDLGAR